jgi:hypothetical protein
MKNSPYLDKPLIPLAVALRSMLADTERKIRTAEPAEKDGLQRRAQLLREWLTPRSTTPLSTYLASGAGRISRARHGWAALVRVLQPLRPSRTPTS